MPGLSWEEQKRRRNRRNALPGLRDAVLAVPLGDASDPAVALASLVGKYLREVLMAKIVTHYREAGAEVPEASGYHDPVTSRFVEATALLRKKRAFPDDCFERRSLAKSTP